MHQANGSEGIWLTNRTIRPILRAQLQADVERLTAELQGSLAHSAENAVRGREHRIFLRENERAMFRGMIDLALTAIKALLIVNGGAAVALY